jgi:hypothetical protein
VQHRVVGQFDASGYLATISPVPGKNTRPRTEIVLIAALSAKATVLKAYADQSLFDSRLAMRDKQSSSASHPMLLTSVQYNSAPIVESAVTM